MRDGEEAVAASPGWPKAHFRLGTALLKKGEHTRAYAAFKRGWHIDPTNAELKVACQQALEQGCIATNGQATVLQAMREKAACNG